ncbi:MAG: TlpA disulfide reductase family protein [Ardenticatenales bacterium]
MTAAAMLVAGFAAGQGFARWRTPPPTPPAESEAALKAMLEKMVAGTSGKGGEGMVSPIRLTAIAASTAASNAGGGAGGGADDGGLSVGLVEPGVASLGEVAPPFSLDGPLSGTTVSLADHHGKAVLLNFWATWCAPCRHEMPFLQAVHDAHAAAADLAVVAIDVDETPEQAAAYLDELGLSFPVGIDRDGRVADQYRIGTYPTTYLIGPDGRVRSMKQGAYTNQYEVEQAASLIVRP